MTEKHETLFIEMRNGAPFEHPILESNLRLFYPNLDPENPPEGYAKFNRIPIRELGPFEAYMATYYEFANEEKTIWQDVHHIRQLTLAERAEKIREARKNSPGEGWALDENTLKWIPPIAPSAPEPKQPVKKKRARKKKINT